MIGKRSHRYRFVPDLEELGPRLPASSALDLLLLTGAGQSLVADLLDLELAAPTAMADTTATGGSGDDTTTGGGGDDTTPGGAGDDTIIGDNGDDTTTTDGDTLPGGDGETTPGGSGDTLPGDDTTPIDDGGGSTPPGGGGDDTTPIDDGGGSTPPGGDGDDTTPIDDGGGSTPPGGGGDDTTPIDDGGGSTPPGGGGDDTTPIDDGGGSTPPGGGDDTTPGGGGDDTTPGGGGDDTTPGGGGDDTTPGGGGDDTTPGGGGDDTTPGGGGDDTTPGGGGDDTTPGGGGDDTTPGGGGDDTTTDGGTTVTINAPDSSACEWGDIGFYRVERSGDTSGELAVSYGVSGTATGGSDYQPLSGQLTIPAGSDRATFTLMPVDDELEEGDESVTATLLPGSYTIGSPDRATITITDDDQNHPPDLQNPGGQFNLPGDAVVLPLWAFDFDDDVLTYDATDLPPGLHINPESGYIEGMIAPDAETGVAYAVTATVDDGALTDSETFAWTIAQWLPVNPGDQDNAVGDTVSLAIQLQGDPGGPLSFTAEGLPDGLNMSPGGQISGLIQLTTGDSEVYTVTVTASDGGSSHSLTFNWWVARLTIDHPGDQHNVVGDTVSLYLTAWGPYDTPLTWTADNLPPGLNLTSNTGVISGLIQPEAETGSPYHVTVTAATPGGAMDEEAFYWYVDYISVENPGDQTYAVGEDVLLQIEAYSGSGESLTFSASNLPDSLTIDPYSGMITGTIYDEDLDGSPYQATVTVMAAGRSVSANFAVVVQQVTIKFDKDKLITGFVYEQGNIKALTATITATISDKTKFNDYEFRMSGVPHNNEHFVTANPAAGTWTIQVTATTPTAANQPNGDMWLGAYKTPDILQGQEVSKVAVIIVVPSKILGPQKTENVVNGKNIALDEDSKPRGVGVPEGKVVLSTGYHVILKRTVLDQFGHTLDALYVGTDVSEILKGETLSTNQKVKADGTYDDPTGWSEWRNDPAGKPLLLSL